MRACRVLCLVFALILAGCGVSVRRGPPAPTPGIIVDTVTLAQGDIIAFPKQPPAKQREAMTALLIGKLVLRDGCLRADPPNAGDSHLLIWPPEFTLVVRGQAIEVLDDRKEVVGRVGEYIYMGGGEGGSEDPQITALTAVSSGLTRGCRRPYWIVGTGVRLYRWDPATPVITDTVDTYGKPLYLLRWTPAIESWLVERKQIVGQLTWVDGCVRVEEDATGDAQGRAYTVVWGLDYAVSMESDPPGLLNGAGLVRRIGERVVLQGREIGPDAAPKETQLLQSVLPEPCGPPYLLVVDERPEGAP